MAALHAKLIVSDVKKSLVSSANLSYHGMQGNVEMGFLIESHDKAKQIEEVMKEMVRMKVCGKYQSILYILSNARKRKYRLYRRLHHQMNCMSLEKKLELINYWIFKYTENYYISPEIQIVIDKDDKLKELSRENNGMPNLGYVTTMDFLFHKDEVKPSEVTNLLREMYAVKK